MARRANGLGTDTSSELPIGYTHGSGEVIEVVPGTVAFFPPGWRGTCRVHETARTIYIIR